MTSFPCDVINKILLKLPIKSLCRFRCICKSFWKLTTNPRFVRLHVSETQSSSRLILNTGSSLQYSIDLESYPHNVSVVKHEILPKLEGSVRFIDSVNGLMLFEIEVTLTNETYFLVYNPCTRESKKVPDSVNGSIYVYTTLLKGFGYSKSSDDYKIVKVTSTDAIHVFSLRNNSWKSVKNNLPSGFSHHESPELGAFHNGAIHWAFPEAIGAFDLDEEKCKILLYPDEIGNINYYFFSAVEVFGDNLCMLYWEKNEFLYYRYDFFIMKEYGVKQSWKRICIDLDEPYCLFRPPLSFGKSGDDLLFLAMNIHSSDVSLVSYGDGWCVKRKIDGIPMSLVNNINVYVESLISPNYYDHFTCQGALGF